MAPAWQTSPDDTYLRFIRARPGGGRGVARDPVCGMQVDKQHPGAVLRSGERAAYRTG